MTSKTTNKFSVEVRARAVRIVQEHGGEYRREPFCAKAVFACRRRDGYDLQQLFLLPSFG